MEEMALCHLISLVGTVPAPLAAEMFLLRSWKARGMRARHSFDCSIRSEDEDQGICDCGSREIQARLDQLESEREAIQRLIANAEEIVIESIGAPYTPRIVYACDLQDVLDGKLR